MKGMIYRMAIAIKDVGERWRCSMLIRIGIAFGDFARSLKVK
jgi:hypothetical protein